MDILLLYSIDFNKAFVFDEDENLIVDQCRMNATKQFIIKWGFMIQIVIGEDDIQYRFTKEIYSFDNRIEMSRLYEMGNELKQRMEQLPNMSL
tara:strand:- start:3947 stop:4225 length:279 start_codon:yes stop_codon:yes gene_type:complete